MYELMVISKTESASEVFDKIAKFLKDADAQVVKSEKLGKKTLAYPIAKQTEGEYFLYSFEADSQVLKGLSDKIRLEQEAILRHLLIKATKPRKESKRPSFAKASEDKHVEEEVKVKPTVTVTTKKKVSDVSKVAKVAKAKEKLKIN